MALVEGVAFPDLTLTDDSGSRWSASDVLTESGFVLFLYPKANTPGCTKQAEGFREKYEEIKTSGYQVFGLSKDKQNAQDKWKNKLKLPYNLLCDDGNSIAELGCSNGASTIRSVFVVKQGGEVILAKRKVSPLESVQMVLDVIGSQSKGKAPEVAAVAGPAKTGRGRKPKGAGIDDVASVSNVEHEALSTTTSMHQDEASNKDSIPDNDSSASETMKPRSRRGTKRTASSAPSREPSKSKTSQQSTLKRLPSRRKLTEATDSVEAKPKQQAHATRAKSTTPAAPKRSSRATEKTTGPKEATTRQPSKKARTGAVGSSKGTRAGRRAPA